MIGNDLALAIDEHILESSSRSARHLETLLAATVLPPLVGELIAALQKDVSISSPLTAVEAGAFVASRMVFKKCLLGQNTAGCMYALADSVKSADAVSIFRWRFIVNEIPELKRSNPGAQLLRQSERVLQAIASLSAESELKWERRVLRV